MPATPKPSSGFLTRLRSAFRERFVVGADYESYMPPTPKSTAAGTKHEGLVYRYPAPASQPPAEIPSSYPETVYDTQYWKRAKIKVKAPPGASQAEFDTFANPAHDPEDDPRHVPHPWWYYDTAAIEHRRKMFVESGGLVAAGVWRNQPDFVMVGRGAQEEFNQHLTIEARAQQRSAQSGVH